MNESALTQNCGWEWSTIGQLGQVQLGRQRSPKNRSKHYATKYLRAANLTWAGLDLSDLLDMEFRPNERETYRLMPGDILLSEASGSATEVGKPAMWRGELDECCFQNTVIRFRSHGPDPRYMLVLFQYLARNGVFASVARGVGIHHLGAERFASIPVPVPPIAEQRRIVATIEEQLTRLDIAVASLLRARANLKRYRSSVISAGVRGTILSGAEESHYATQDTGSALLRNILELRRTRLQRDPTNGRMNSYQEPSLPASLPNLQLPASWAWASVAQLAGLVTDGDHNPPKRVSSGVPHLTAKNIKRGQLNLAGCTFITLADFKRTKARFEPQANDIIVTCVGTVGEVAVVPDGLVFSADRNLAGIRLVSPGADPQWVALVLSSSEWQNIIAAASGSTAQPHLYLGDLRPLAIPLPSLAMQRRILAEVEVRLSGVVEAQDSIDANLKRAKRLRQAILKRAFEGTLVAQHPADESASVALARIHTERTARNATAGRLQQKKAGPQQAAAATQEPLPI